MPRRQRVILALVVVQRQAELLHVVLALQARRGLTDMLDRGQRQAHQDRNDRDDNEEFDQGEGVVRITAAWNHQTQSSARLLVRGPTVRWIGYQGRTHRTGCVP